MFTGIIEEVGKIDEIKRNGQSVSLTIQAKKVLEDIKEGDSIAVNGICLTAAAFTDHSFTADVMHETLNRTALCSLRTKSPVNLERAMPASGRFGGHIVAGHVDGTGVISRIEKDSNAVWYHISTEKKILRYIVEKGSIAIDGISLTVAAVDEKSFSVSVIPHTLANTALVSKRVQDTVNLENDCVGKYIEKFVMEQTKPSRITKEFLLRNGF
ncbi:MAG: riboflavin synthase [Agathobacter sp.]|nr:riboflavin synthase [Agathobacter sp.]